MTARRHHYVPQCYLKGFTLDRDTPQLFVIDGKEHWLHELSIDMFPEDGRLYVYGVGEDGVTAFTEYGIECLQQIIANERAAGRAPPQVNPPK